jgi:flagellar basal-body rod protein FlgG
VADDGTVSVGSQTAGKLRVVDFGDYSELQREDLGRFRVPTTVTPTEAPTATVRSGMLEASNVSVVDRMVALTEVSRGFEALQRGLNILSTELDGRAITELGRR